MIYHLLNALKICRQLNNNQKLNFYFLFIYLTTYTNYNLHKLQLTQTTTYTNYNLHKLQLTQTTTYTNYNLHKLQLTQINSSHKLTAVDA